MAELATRTPTNPNRITYTDEEQFKPSDAAGDMFSEINRLRADKERLGGYVDQYKKDRTSFNFADQDRQIRSTENEIKTLDDQLKQRQKAYDEQIKQEKQQYGVKKQFTNLGKQAQENSAQYRMAFPSLLDAGMGQMRTQARRAISSGTNANTANYNKRGLLFSGLRAGADADVVGDVSNQLNEGRAALNEQLLAKQNELDQAPIDIAAAQNAFEGNIANTNNAFTQQVLDALMQKQNANTQAIGSLIGAGGELAGTLGGGLLSRSTKSTPSDYFSSQYPASIYPELFKPFGR